MFERIKAVFQKIRASANRTSRDDFLPRAVPSVEEAILPFDPEEYAIFPNELKQMMDTGKDFILLDVRETWEYHIGHIEGAVSIPLGELPRRFTELPPGEEIIVYCHKGMRSLDAAVLLQQLGVRSVLSVAGGIDRWAEEIDSTIQRY